MLYLSTVQEPAISAYPFTILTRAGVLTAGRLEVIQYQQTAVIPHNLNKQRYRSSISPGKSTCCDVETKPNALLQEDLGGGAFARAQKNIIQNRPRLHGYLALRRFFPTRPCPVLLQPGTGGLLSSVVACPYSRGP